MKRCLKYILYTFAALSLSTCKTPYTPAPITTVSNYLVVEGFINITDSTYINLSRSVGVMSKSTVKPELKATITIESNQGGSYPLKELGNGVYAAAPLNLRAANQYRLRIKTTNGNTYTSDFEQTKVTPPIDSVITAIEPDGLHIGVSTHDPQNNTRYYRWDYSETWQFTSFYDSHYTAQGAATSPAAMSPLYLQGIGIAVLPRTNDIYHCWGNTNSATILLNTTAGLSQDILVNSPITYVPSPSEKLSIRYSILIRQYALTSNAYDFWTLLKKNTEQLGSIFDSQPSASVGNIHNITNPAEPVIGYISTSTISQKRIYLNYTDLPKSYVSDYLNNDLYNANTCGLDAVQVVDSTLKGHELLDFGEYENFIRLYPGAPQIPVDILSKVDLNHDFPLGSHTGAIPICVDCTLRGTNIKPAFWQ